MERSHYTVQQNHRIISVHPIQDPQGGRCEITYLSRGLYRSCGKQANWFEHLFSENSRIFACDEHVTPRES